MKVNKFLIILVFILLVGIAYFYGKSQSAVLGTQAILQPTEVPIPTFSVTQTPIPSIKPTVVEKIIYQQVTQAPLPTITPTSTSVSSTQVSNLDSLCRSKASLAIVEFNKRTAEMDARNYDPRTYEGFKSWSQPYVENLRSELYWKTYDGCLRGHIKP